MKKSNGLFADLDAKSQVRAHGLRYNGCQTIAASLPTASFELRRRVFPVT
jgi:hypothetical protein